MCYSGVSISSVVSRTRLEGRNLCVVIEFIALLSLIVMIGFKYDIWQACRISTVI
jgi:hypothetical protein